MKKYETLVIGSSFASVGFALGGSDVLIAEQTEMLDTSFYLPMINFDYKEYEPKTELGRELLGIFESYGMISGGKINVNALEIALARFVDRHRANVYLKCRVVESRKTERGYTVTLLHNGGLEQIEVSRIIDARPDNKGERRLTVLFDTEGDAATESLNRVFPNAVQTVAFYSGRYAAYIPCPCDDINDAKVDIYRKWEATTGLRILYIAPAFHYTEAIYPLSAGAENPIEALENGMLYAKEGRI